MNRYISPKDLKVLYGLSAGRCNKCGTLCIIKKEGQTDYIHVGEMAHIYSYANNPNAPRFIKGNSGDNSHSNLILLCSNCHTIVDNNSEYYTAETLLQIKSEHYQKVASEHYKNNQNKDQMVIDIINQFCNFQAIYSNLNSCVIDKIPEDVLDIGMINESFLYLNNPTLYPFRDEQLTNFMTDILKHFYDLEFYLSQYYTLVGANHLHPYLAEVIPDLARKDISKVIERLKNSLYSWLLYVRERYSP